MVLPARKPLNPSTLGDFFARQGIGYGTGRARRAAPRRVGAHSLRGDVGVRMTVNSKTRDPGGRRNAGRTVGEVRRGICPMVERVCRLDWTRDGPREPEIMPHLQKRFSCMEGIFRRVRFCAGPGEPSF